MPAAQAWGLAAVGYAIGNGVSDRSKPAKTSGSDQAMCRAASSSARLMRWTGSKRP